MANTNSELRQPGSIPDLGLGASIPQSPDINSYSDRMLAREAGRPGETAERVFEGLSNRLGNMADQAAEYEGRRAGEAAGADPNYRPNDDESIRGRAFNSAATAGYLNNLDASAKSATTAAYDQYMALPPAQRNPADFAKTLGGIQSDFQKNHVFPEVQAGFNSRFTEYSTALLQGAQRDLEKRTKDNADASFMTREDAIGDAASRLAAQGLTDTSGTLDALRQQQHDLIDEGVSAGVWTQTEAVGKKQKFDDGIATLHAKAMFDNVPDAEKPAYYDKFSKGLSPYAPGANGLGLINAPYTRDFNAPGEKGIVSPAQLYSYLTDKGATRNEALLLTSAAGSESSFNAEAVHDNGNGYGLFGHNVRRLDLRGQNWQSQATAALAELRSRPEAADVAAAKTPQDLADAEMRFEQPRGYTASNPRGGDNYSGRLNTIKLFASATGGGLGGSGDLEDRATRASDAASLTPPTGMSFGAWTDASRYMGSQLRAIDSQARQAESTAVSTVEGLTKRTIADDTINRDELAGLQQAYANSPSPRVNDAMFIFDRTKTAIDGFKTMRPDEINAQIADMEGKAAKAGGLTPQVQAVLDNLKAYSNKLAGDLKDAPLDRAAREGIVGPIASLNASDPNLSKALQSRLATVQHVSSQYGEDVPFFLKGEGSAFASQLASGGAPLASVANKDQIAAMAEDEGFRKALVANSRSGDPSRMQASFGAMQAIADADPMAFEGRFGKEAQANMDAWRSLISYQPADEAAKRMMALNDPNTATTRKYYNEAADKALSKVTPAQLVSQFSQATWLNPFSWSNGAKEPAATPDMVQSSIGALQSDYREAYKDSFALTGSADAASQNATTAVQRKWGVSAVNGNRLMLYPPERVYQHVDGSYDWLSKQLDADVKKAAGDMGTVPGFTPSGAPEDMPPVDDRSAAQREAAAKYNAPRALVADAQTKADIDAGKPPSYRVIIQDPQGQFHALEARPGVPLRFFGDHDAAQAEAEARFNAARPQVLRDEQQMLETP